MTVVGGDDNEGVLELANLLEVLQGRPKSVVELEEVTEGAVDVLNVHLLVDELRGLSARSSRSRSWGLTAASDMSEKPVPRALARVWRMSIALRVISLRPGWSYAPRTP